MIATTTQTTADDWKVIVELKIDGTGKVAPEEDEDRPGRKDTLDDKLIGRIYPGIRVARLSVPSVLSAYEQSVVEESMKRIDYGGVVYKLAGASGSAKDGKFYFVDEKYALAIAKRFQFSPQAAITYFSILISDCRVVIEEPDLTIAVVKDHVLGTNDCRGWIRKSIYRKLRLGPNWFCQFRLAFDADDPKQAKGGLKTIHDKVADILGVDMILPESSCKPELKGSVRFLPQLKTSGRLFKGPAILGVKQWSRESVFMASSSLVENASEEAFRLDILPRALENARAFTKACDQGDHTTLLEILNKHEVPSSDSSFDPETFENGDGSVPEPWDPVEAVLLADQSGNALRFPYVLNHLDRRCARWAYRVCTSGGFTLPSFALVDDGVLIEHEGKVLCASDWIPKDVAITSLASENSLCVRYPIRMQEDLLPVRHIRDVELVPALKQALGVSYLPETLVDHVLERQLRMEGTYILHSETAALNGGDFDFDSICAVPSDEFPKFYEGRVAYGQQYKEDQKKNRTGKAKSIWWNLERVAMKARGNRIGSITDLKTSCMAAGRIDKAHQLVRQLQNALDSLKWNTTVDEELVAEIRDEIEPAPWLKHKRIRRASELPDHLEVAGTDKIGRLYNHVRKELGDVFKERRTIEDFRGLFTGATVSKEMFEECQLVNSIYGDVIAQITEQDEQLKADLEVAQKQAEALRKSEDKELRRAAWEARNKAQAAFWEYEIQARRRFRALHLFIRYWAQGKQNNRQAWAQAMNTVVSNGKGTGGVLFQSFPQEIVDTFANMTGGESRPVRLPKTVEGHVQFDDQRRAFLVEPIINPEGPEGEKRIFLFQYQGDRKLVFENTSIPASPENS
jgi:hypothetical protein